MVSMVSMVSKELETILSTTFTTGELNRRLWRWQKNWRGKSDKLKELEETTQKLPRLTLILATPLPHRDVVKIAKFLRQNVHPHLLLDLRTDPQIIGGCQIVYQGRFGDFSIKKKLSYGREIMRRILLKTK